MKNWKVGLLVFLSLCIVGQSLDVWKFSRDYLYDDDTPYEAAPDFAWLEGGSLVVHEGKVEDDWTLGNGNAHEGENYGVTYFLFAVEQGEKFGPLDYGVVGAPATKESELAQGTGDKDVSMIIFGDAFAGNLDSSEGVLQARVVYNCLAPFQNKKLFIRLSFIDATSQVSNVTWSWTKSCGSGPRKGFSVTVNEFPQEFYDDDEEVVDFDDEDDQEESFDYTVVSDGRTRTAWDWANPTHRFVSVYAPDFILQIQRGYGSQVYGSPFVTVADPTILKVNIIDAHDATHNVLSEFTENAVMKVIQICTQNHGETKVSMEIDLGSNEPVRFSWIKSCDGGKSSGFDVQTERTAQKPNVIEKGLVTSDWNTSAPKTKVLANVQTSSFWIKTPGAGITFDRIYAIAKPRDMLTAIVSPRKISANGQANEIKVEYRCLTKGTAQVTMVLIQGAAHDPVKFTWLKECPKRVRTVQQGYMTANRAMFLFCFVVLVLGLLGGYTWVQWKRRKIAEKKARLQQQNYETM